MADRNQLRRRILLDVLAYRPALALLTVSVTAALAAWAMARSSGWLLFGALAGILCAKGILLTRFFLFGNDIARRCADDLQREEMQKREAELDRMQTRLEGPAPEAAAMLRDLRAMLAAFRVLAAQQEAPYDLVIGVEQLFDRCIEALGQTEALWTSACNLSTQQAREAILGQRTRIMEDVRQSLRQFERVLKELQSFKPGDGEPSALAQIRTDLDQTLATAKTADAEPVRRTMTSGAKTTTGPP